MANARIILTIERDVPDSGSGAPDLGHDAYYLKKQIEQDEELKGNPRVVDIKIEQPFRSDRLSAIHERRFRAALVPRPTVYVTTTSRTMR